MWDAVEHVLPNPLRPPLIRTSSQRVNKSLRAWHEELAHARAFRWVGEKKARLEEGLKAGTSWNVPDGNVHDIVREG
jgi:hypothetical protein